jgi:hypothetical protein
MPSTSFDPHTLKPWWVTLDSPDGVLELHLAQRKGFYVLLTHHPGQWVAIVGEGGYSGNLPASPNILAQGELMDFAFKPAERYIRQRDPSYKADWPSHLFD